MSLRELEFVDKFWTLPGGITLIAELVLALIHRRIMLIDRVKQEREGTITQEQMSHCNMLTSHLNFLGYSFRSFLNSCPGESLVIQRLTEVIIEYKKVIRDCHRRLRCLFIPEEPGEDETSKTLLMKLTGDPGTIPYYKAMAIELIRLYICYIEVTKVIVETYTHYGQPIGLNILGIEYVIHQLRTISSTLERMTIMPTDLRSNETRNCDPLYLLLRKFHYLIKTFHLNNENLLPLQSQ